MTGYSLHKNLQRPLKGTLNEDKEGYLIELNEPGDNPYDGKFSAVIDHQVREIKEKWTPLANSELSGTEFVLSKQ